MEDKHNLNVYVSNLPLDITDEEFTELMKKCGLIMFDPKKRTPKLKLYKDENGQPKGDGLCCYIKVRKIYYLRSDVKNQYKSIINYYYW